MNINVASQNQGVIAWVGGAVTPGRDVDLRGHIQFGFTFHVKTTIAVAAVFNLQAAPPSDADRCDPGTYVDVPEVLICDWMKTPATSTRITIPAGTQAGSICTGTLPCKPDAFIKFASVSGDTANVDIVAVLGGPR